MEEEEAEGEGRLGEEHGRRKEEKKREKRKVEREEIGRKVGILKNDNGVIIVEIF